MKKLLFILPVLLILFSCEKIDEKQTLDHNTFGKEMAVTEENQSNLLKKQPPVKLDYSLERKNIIERTKRWNNENKVSYIYLLSYGNIISFYPIKGKVSSVNSTLTNPEQIVLTADYDVGEAHGRSAHVVSSPQEDGSYGTNGDAIFFFTTDGTYVEWNSEYLLVDKPLKVTQPVALVEQVGATTKK